MDKTDINFTPKNEESLLGLLLRFRSTYDFSSLYSVLKTAGIKYDSKGHLWRLADHAENLANMLNIPEHTIQDMGFTRETLGLGIYKARAPEGWSIPSSLVDTSSARVCPQCLKEDRHFAHRTWDFPFVTCCPKHKVQLIDTCPSCGKGLTWNRRHVGCCTCGHDLSSAPSDPINNDVLTFTRHLLHTMELDSLEEEKIRILPDMSPEQLLTLAWALYRIARPKYQGSKSFHGRRNLQDWIEIQRIAGGMLSIWPHSIINMCMQTQPTSMNMDRVPPSMMLGWPYKVMNRLSEGEAKQFIRTALSEIAPPKSKNELKGQDLLDELRAHHAKTVCATEACRILGIGRKMLRRLTDDNSLKQERVSGKKLLRWDIASIEIEFNRCNPTYTIQVLNEEKANA